MYQARQFIVHGHIIVNDKKITTPSYIVPKADEDKIGYYYKSTFVTNRAKIWGTETEAAEVSAEHKEEAESDKGKDKAKAKRQKEGMNKEYDEKEISRTKDGLLHIIATSNDYLDNYRPFQIGNHRPSFGWYGC